MSNNESYEDEIDEYIIELAKKDTMIFSQTKVINELKIENERLKNIISSLTEHNKKRGDKVEDITENMSEIIQNNITDSNINNVLCNFNKSNIIKFAISILVGHDEKDVPIAILDKTIAYKDNDTVQYIIINNFTTIFMNMIKPYIYTYTKSIVKKDGTNIEEYINDIEFNTKILENQNKLISGDLFPLNTILKTYQKL